MNRLSKNKIVFFLLSIGVVILSIIIYEHRYSIIITRSDSISEHLVVAINDYYVATSSYEDTEGIVINEGDKVYITNIYEESVYVETVNGIQRKSVPIECFIGTDVLKFYN